MVIGFDGKINISPFLPSTVSELLPKHKGDHAVVFVACGPPLIDALSSGESIQDAATKAGLTTEDAIKLLASLEFRKYVEAYLSINDIENKSGRIRFAKALLAAKVTEGDVRGRKRDPLDILEYIRREQHESKGTNVNIALINSSVPRPYGDAKEKDLATPETITTEVLSQ